jgi:hypothetical protein
MISPPAAFGNYGRAMSDRLQGYNNFDMSSTPLLYAQSSSSSAYGGSQLAAREEHDLQARALLPQSIIGDL